MSSRFQSEFLTLTLKLHGPSGRGFNLWQTSLLQYSPTLCPEQTSGLSSSIWNVLFKIVSCSVMAWPPHYLKIHLSNSEDRESLNVGPCVRHRLSSCENLTLFSGNCPLWERIKRSNGSRVLWWNQKALLATKSLLSKQTVSVPYAVV